MIPKRIFYVWGVNDAKKRDVQVCIQTWRQYMPDYEIIEINEASVEYFDFQKELKENSWFKAVYDRQMWAYVSDYIRVNVLYNNGGIYFDTDVSAVGSMDEFLNEPMFVGLQSPQYTEPAIMGAEKENLFLKDVLSFYQEKIWHEPIFPIPKIFEYYLKEKHGLSSFPAKDKQEIIRLADISIYPQRFFIPFGCGEVFNPECVEKDTKTIHWYGGSWCKPEIVKWLKNKHKKSLQENLKVEFDARRTVCLFGLIPLCSFDKNKKALSICGVSFLKAKEKGTKTILTLFGCIPLFKIK